MAPLAADHIGVHELSVGGTVRVSTEERYGSADDGGGIHSKRMARDAGFECYSGHDPCALGHYIEVKWRGR